MLKIIQNICLLGDFNVRIGKLKDYVCLDNFLVNYNNMDEEIW